MNQFEKMAINIRHLPVIENIDPLWHVIRPIYCKILHAFGRRGLTRIINGSDIVLVVPDLYVLPETYESEVWPVIMQEVRPGDVVADVGAYVGLYTIAIANRVGPQGYVHSFEPNPRTLPILQRHVTINNVGSCVMVHPYAMSENEGIVYFEDARASESRIVQEATTSSVSVRCTTLDTMFATGQVNVLKIDVEGFEEHVLRGGHVLLRDVQRGPRTIFIEVHPFAWQAVGISSASLVNLLHSYNYAVFDLAGRPMEQILEYGEIVARRITSVVR